MCVTFTPPPPPPSPVAVKASVPQPLLNGCQSGFNVFLLENQSSFLKCQTPICDFPSLFSPLYTPPELVGCVCSLLWLLVGQCSGVGEFCLVIFKTVLA